MKSDYPYKLSFPSDDAVDCGIPLEERNCLADVGEVGRDAEVFLQDDHVLGQLSDRYGKVTFENELIHNYS